MPSFAANLAVFNGEVLAGKVTLAPGPSAARKGQQP
jgi:hypothetical protein